MKIWNLTAKSCHKCHESERKCVKKKKKREIKDKSGVEKVVQAKERHVKSSRGKS